MQKNKCAKRKFSVQIRNEMLNSRHPSTGQPRTRDDVIADGHVVGVVVAGHDFRVVVVARAHGPAWVGVDGPVVAVTGRGGLAVGASRVEHRVGGSLGRGDPRGAIPRVVSLDGSRGHEGRRAGGHFVAKCPYLLRLEVL